MHIQSIDTARYVKGWLYHRLFPGPLILMYHRVADAGTDPWSLCVSPQHFAEHLEVIRRRFQACRLDDLQDRQQSSAWRRGVVLTFDDGYADNFHNARRLLEENDIPATVFVTTGNLQQDREFWWDELDRLLLQPGTIPESLEVQVGAQSYRWKLGPASQYGEADYARYRNWSAERSDDPTLRHVAYREIWELLGQLDSRELSRTLDQLVQQTGAEPKSRPTHRSMTFEEVAELGASGLIEIGAHTVTHPHLARLSRDQQWTEIRDSRELLESVAGTTVASFSYPHGSQTKTTRELVRQAGYLRACNSDCRAVRRHCDPYGLPRIVIEDCSGDQFEKLLAWWMPG